MAIKRKNKFITPSLAVLTQLEFSPEDAKKSWKRIVEQKWKLETKLGHAISLMTAVCYYFSDAKKYQNPAYHRIKTALGNKKTITFRWLNRTFKPAIFWWCFTGWNQSGAKIWWLLFRFLYRSRQLKNITLHTVTRLEN